MLPMSRAHTDSHIISRVCYQTVRRVTMLKTLQHWPCVVTLVSLIWFTKYSHIPGPFVKNPATAQKDSPQRSQYCHYSKQQNVIQKYCGAE